jgi:hypothetical protein
MTLEADFRTTAADELAGPERRLRRIERGRLDSPLALVLIACVVGVIWLWRAHRGRRHAAEKKLRRICLGNERQAERLIEWEMTRAPGLSRAEAARRAVERYQRDNR